MISCFGVFENVRFLFDECGGKVMCVASVICTKAFCHVSKSVRFVVRDVSKSVTLQANYVSESVLVQHFLLQKRVNYGTENL